jgi:uncharacterized protein (DUF2147 family)
MSGKLIVRGLLAMLCAAAMATVAAWVAPGAATAQADSATMPASDAVVGIWVTEEEDARIEIYREGDRFDGKIVWIENPTYTADEDPVRAGQPRTDDDNPDPELRGQPILGMRLLHGFEYKGDRKWEGGRIYDPENGKTYKCKMRLEDGVLKIRGYVGISLLGRTTEWRRYESEQRESEATG